MEKVNTPTSALLVDRAEFAPALGRCACCGQLAMMPEPHLATCPQYSGPAGPVYRYQLDQQPIIFNPKNLN